MSFAAWQEAIGNDAPELVQLLGHLRKQNADREWLEKAVALPFLRKLAFELREARERQAELREAFLKLDAKRNRTRALQHAIQAQRAAVATAPPAADSRYAVCKLAQMVEDAGRELAAVEIQASQAACAWVAAMRRTEGVEAKIASMPTTRYDATAAAALCVDVDELGPGRRVCDCRGDGTRHFPYLLELVDGRKLAMAG